ncbi:MAG: endolytic transglycosylase MltG [Clostridia bacterium]|nr:endolytic transglycosylase MltG [Clostridia bacterium]
MDNNINKNPQNNEDDFIIGKGFPTLEEEEEMPVKRKKRGKHIIRNTIWIIAILLISVGIGFGVVVVGSDYLGIGFGRGDNCTVEIDMGMGTAGIAKRLNEGGAVKSPIAFRIYSRLKGFDGKYKYGVYTFNTEAGYESICEMLMTQGAKAESVTVTIPEGTGINDYTKNVNGKDVTVPGIATLLEKAGVCTRADFIAALNDVKLDSKLLKNVNVGKTYHELEGYLFPETYDFYSYDSKECAVLAVEKMIKETENRISDEMFKQAEKMGYSMNEILTMASIVQMEAGESNSEMANVAAIFYNRLNSDNFATLGSSPTCYYGESFRNDDGRYDTYKIKGLPPGPLCSPGIDAIKAALYPTEDTPYYYFVTDSNGKFYYHKTFEEQQATKKRLKQGNNWTYEYLD